MRPVKCKNGGIGGGGTKNKASFNRSKLKPISKVQRKRNQNLRSQKEELLNAMHEVWGGAFCMAQGKAGFECFGELEWDHVKPRSRGRDDTFFNCQLLCHAHHNYKTVTPGLYAFDFRDKQMKQFCADLDKK